MLGDPNALADALEKLHKGMQLQPAQTNPAITPLFIVNPFANGLSSLFSTHPPISDRLARLRQMVGISRYAVRAA